MKHRKGHYYDNPCFPKEQKIAPYLGLSSRKIGINDESNWLYFHDQQGGEDHEQPYLTTLFYNDKKSPKRGAYLGLNKL